MGNKKRSKGNLNRKAERKAERQNTKKKKAQYFSQPRVNQSSALKRTTTDEHHTAENERPPKRRKAEHEQVVGGKRIGGALETEKKKKEQTTKAQSYQKADIFERDLGRSRREEEEDAYIAMLEKRLGASKAKDGKSKYRSELEQDGLLGMQVLTYLS